MSVFEHWEESMSLNGTMENDMKLGLYMCVGSQNHVCKHVMGPDVHVILGWSLKSFHS
jgi:hypothetical protein